MVSNSSSLNDWVSRLSDVEMPIFGTTVQSIISVSEKDSSNLSDLTEVILRDSSMTARVLKLVNSIFYNPTSQPINTISRAVTLIGFDTVRSICLSISLVDSLVRDGNRKQLIQEMSRAVHAAIQARNMASRINDKSPEEVFVATLLSRIGQMAFWCYGKDEANQLQAMLQVPDIDPEQAERKVLGFKLNELTKGLAKAWNMDGMMADVLDEKRRTSTRGQIITLSQQLADHAEKGWHSTQVEGIIEDIAKLLDDPVEKVTKELYENAKDAASIASRYGADAVSDTIPLPDNMHKENNGTSHRASPLFNQPDPSIQLNILGEVMDMINGPQPQLKLLLEMLLEGIHRGVGTDNALIALLSNDRYTLLPKYVLGSFREKLLTNFSVIIDGNKPNIFHSCLSKKTPYRVDKDFLTNNPTAINKGVINATATEEFMITPLLINGQAAGVIYADRAASKRPLDNDTYNNFNLFGKAACMAIEYMAMKKTAKR